MLQVNRCNFAGTNQEQIVLRVCDISKELKSRLRFIPKTAEGGLLQGLDTTMSRLWLASPAWSSRFDWAVEASERGLDASGKQT